MNEENHENPQPW